MPVPGLALLLEATRDGAGVLVEVVAARGSTPRGTDAFMLVTATRLAGTIGGGQLEFHAIDVARDMLRGGAAARTLDVPLGPHLGQCCGGHVTLALTRLDAKVRAGIVAREAARSSLAPSVVILGLGHTGCAMAAAQAPPPARSLCGQARG